MIAVSVRQKYEICRDFFDVDRFCQWIAGDEWIEQKFLAGDLDSKTCMAVVAKLHESEGPKPRGEVKFAHSIMNSHSSLGD